MSLFNGSVSVLFPQKDAQRTHLHLRVQIVKPHQQTPREQVVFIRLKQVIYNEFVQLEAHWIWLKLNTDFVLKRINIKHTQTL